MAGFLADTLAKRCFLMEDRCYDALLREEASGYAKFHLTGAEQALVEQLRRNAEAFRWNWEACTSEMRWTDRVLAVTGNYLQYLPEQGLGLEKLGLELPPQPPPRIGSAQAVRALKTRQAKSKMPWRPFGPLACESTTYASAQPPSMRFRLILWSANFRSKTGSYQPAEGQSG